MNVQTVEWHRNCQRNFRRFIDEKKTKLEVLAEEVARSERDWAFRESQIREAVKQGKTSFDGERFMKCVKGVVK